MDTVAALNVVPPILFFGLFVFCAHCVVNDYAAQYE